MDAANLLKEMHDLALKNRPEDASHDEEACDICKADKASQDDPDLSGGDIVETFTKEQHEAALEEALKPLREEIARLKATQVDSEVQVAVDAAKAEAAEELAKVNEELTGVRAELDAAQIEKNTAVEDAENARKEFEEFKTELTELEAAEQAAQERDSRKAERIEKVLEVAKFNDDEVAAKADRWADMDDEEFASLIEEFKVVAAKAVASTGSESHETAMRTITTVSDDGGASALSFLSEARAAGYVPGRKF